MVIFKIAQSGKIEVAEPIGEIESVKHYGGATGKKTWKRADAQYETTRGVGTATVGPLPCTRRRQLQAQINVPLFSSIRCARAAGSWRKSS